MGSITPEEILHFLNQLTVGRKQSTKKLRYSLLSAFFSFIKNSFNPQLQNPCDTPILRKTFRNPQPNQWKILEKETVDEIIFRTVNPRNRLIPELMARGGMRDGEVLQLKPKNMDGKKLILNDPKSGRQTEVVFIPQKMSERLKSYVREKGIEPDQRVFPISYPAARNIVKKAGKLVGIDLNPHDLRRHAVSVRANHLEELTGGRVARSFCAPADRASTFFEMMICFIGSGG